VECLASGAVQSGSLAPMKGCPSNRSGAKAVMECDLEIGQILGTRLLDAGGLGSNVVRDVQCLFKVIEKY